MRIGALRFYWSACPTDGPWPWFSGRQRLSEGAAWLIEWRRLWIWWEPERLYAVRQSNGGGA